MTLVDTTCSSQLSLARTTGTPGSPDRQGCFEQREDPLQMCATNSLASVSRLEPEAGRECPWMSIQREEEKAPAWLAQSWQLLSGLGTIKAKSALKAIFNRQFDQIRPCLAQCWSGLRFTIICPVWREPSPPFQEQILRLLFSVKPPLWKQAELTPVLNVLTFWLLLSCLQDTASAKILLQGKPKDCHQQWQSQDQDLCLHTPTSIAHVIHRKWGARERGLKMMEAERNLKATLGLAFHLR